MATVDMHNVRKSFGKVDVINDVSFTMQDGEFLALVGPSGCGKSTLLRMIAGLETISAGDIVIGDRVVNDLSSKHRDVAMVFQSYALYPNLKKPVSYRRSATAASSIPRSATRRPN